MDPQNSDHQQLKYFSCYAGFKWLLLVKLAIKVKYTSKTVNKLARLNEPYKFYATENVTSYFKMWTGSQTIRATQSLKKMVLLEYKAPNLSEII